jgi:uncharacterized protein YdeI (YjbR/CyaY-like superfamily)
MDTVFFTSAADFRAWLEENYATAHELWIGFYKKSSGQTGMTYLEAVDQALCFGWIDGIRKTVDVASYTNRFTPRKKKSTWSAVNIKRVAELTQAGLMHPSGIAAFEERDQARSGSYSYEQDERTLAEPYEAAFREHPAAWTFFQAQPPGQRRLAGHWVMSAKKEETRLRRLTTLIEDAEKGIKLSQTLFKK